MGRHSKEEPRDVSEAVAARISVGTATGYHRAVGQVPRRGLAKWLIAALVAVALIGAGGYLLTWGNDVLNSPAVAEANDCHEGHRTIRIVVAPEIGAAIKDVAKQWSDTKPVINSHCITVDVDAVKSADVIKDLRQDGAVRAVPAVWIPEFMSWAYQLQQSNPERVPSDARPLVSWGKSGDFPFVLISGPGVDDIQERAAQTFRQFLLEPKQLNQLAKALDGTLA